MKFDVIIGNPPYQDDGSSHRTSPYALYPAFMMQAVSLKPNLVSMIIPSRWALGGGLGVKEFREFMFTSKHLHRFVDICDAKEVFKEVDVTGGICYFLLDFRAEIEAPLITIKNQDLYTDTRHRPLKELLLYVRYPELINVLKKTQLGPCMCESNRSGTGPLIHGLESNVVSGPYAGDGENSYRLKSNAFTYPENAPGMILIHQKRGVGYLPEDSLKDPRGLLPKYKVLVTRLGGGEGVGKLQGYPKVFIALPNEAFTGTYQSIDAFDTLEAAQNCKQYLETDFVTVIHGACKSSIGNRKTSFWAVPAQDFTQPWPDEKLYKKYNLTQEEIQFIEKMVKPRKGI